MRRSEEIVNLLFQNVNAKGKRVDFVPNVVGSKEENSVKALTNIEIYQNLNKIV